MKGDLNHMIEWRRRELAVMDARMKAGEYQGKETAFQEMYSIVKRQLMRLEGKLQRAV